jgi:hypothetical protein
MDSLLTPGVPALMAAHVARREAILARLPPELRNWRKGVGNG